MRGTGDLLSAFDVDAIELEALRFQTGYLTIRDEEGLGGEPLYRLGYPNCEVRQSFNRVLLCAPTPDPSRQLATSVRLRELLAANDFGEIETLFRAFFSSIPYEWHTKNEIARCEGYYASVLFPFASAGLDVVVEDSGSLDRVDMAVRFHNQVYLFKLKAVETTPTDGAMAQLKAKGCANKYRSLGQPIHLVGVEFSREIRNLVAFAVEDA